MTLAFLALDDVIEVFPCCEQRQLPQDFSANTNDESKVGNRRGKFRDGQKVSFEAKLEPTRASCDVVGEAMIQHEIRGRCSFGIRPSDGQKFRVVKGCED